MTESQETMKSGGDKNEVSSSSTGVAGRTDYATWDKVAKEMVQQVEQEEQQEEHESKTALGLDGKYARSQAEAEEREKAAKAAAVKKKLNEYEKRELRGMQTFSNLLGPVGDNDTAQRSDCKQLQQEEKSREAVTVRITRERMEAGKRVVAIADTSGSSLRDTIVLTQDLSHLESKMPPSELKPKEYPEDAENHPTATTEQQKEKTIYGLIKLFLTNLHHCTVLIKCKIISGTIEIHKCSNVTVRMESNIAVPTVQCDQSSNLTLQYVDSLSGKSMMTGYGASIKPDRMYWGDDKDDRIYHAGVSNLRVELYRDGYIEQEHTADYMKDGAVAIGNATAEEFQFITSVVDGSLTTEAVSRSGASTGKNARIMTEREVAQEKEMRKKATERAVEQAEQMISLKDKDGNELVTKNEDGKVEECSSDNKGQDAVEEVFTAMSQEQIEDIVKECEENKARGNEAFQAGEYGQAILLYSLALDKADELPDKDSEHVKTSLFPRDVVYSNRAACFLKLGQHEKAEQDARRALEINPANVKASFRCGLALHAAAQYQAALPFLAKAYKLEPKNKQIQQALQFCEVRIAQEERKRMQS